MADRDVSVKYVIQGDESGMVAAMSRAGAATKAFESQMGGVSSAIGKLSGVVGAVAGVLAGGAMFKNIVEETVKWTGESIKLSKALGITTEEASVLNLALGDVYLSHETMIAGSTRLTRTLSTNEDAFKRLGIETRTSDGHFRAIGDIMTDTNKKLLSLKEGTDRNLVGVQLYGKGWQEASGLLKLTQQVMEDARKKAEELHLIVGPDSVAKMKAYKAAMNDVEDPWMAGKIMVGEQLLPVLTSMGMWLADNGPAALTIFGGALKGVITFMEYATLGASTLGTIFVAALEQVGGVVATVYQMLVKVMSGDFRGAVETGKQGWLDFNKTGAAAYDSIAAAAEKTNDRVARLWGLRPPMERQAAPKGTDRFDNPENSKDVHARQMAVEQARLQAVLAGLKGREEMQKETVKTLTAEEEFYLRTGLMFQEDFDRKKYELERTGLQNTLGLIDQELAAIEASSAKKLALADTAEEKQKVQAETQKEREARLTEKQKTNQELYRLDLEYFTATTALDRQKRFDEASMLSGWAAQRLQSDQEVLIRQQEFYAMRQELAGNAFAMERFRINQEQDAWIRSYAMQTSSFEVYEQRKAQIEQYYAIQREKINRNEMLYKMNLASQGFGNMASIADSFYQLSGKKSREALLAYQVMKSGETVISTASAAMKSYDAMASIPYVGPVLGAIAAASAVAAGMVQLQQVWSVSPDGSGGGMSTAGLSGVSATPVQTTVANTATSTSGANVTVNIIGNVVDHDKFARETIPAIQRALADGAHYA